LAKISIAAAQTIPVKGNIAENIKRHEKLIKYAAEKEVDILLFPELSLTGYEMELASDLSMSFFDKRIHPLMSLSRNHNMIIIAGAPVRVDKRLYIGAFVLNPDGSLSLYLKHHLHSGEEKVFKPGHLNPMIYSGSDKASIAICADLTHPDHPADAARNESTLYLAGAFITPEGYSKDSDLLKKYARKYKMGVALSNFGGESGGNISAGKSAIWSDAGEKVAGLDGLGEGLVIAKKINGRWSGKSMIIQ
jgi:predicted amidohydrolase